MNLTATPIVAADAPWIPLSPGVSFKPLRFGKRGRSLQLRVEPGVLVPPHRHTGAVHAFNLSGSRELVEKGEIAGPGAYVYEPPGNVDSWRAVGEEPCVVLINLTGRVEYIDENGAVAEFTDTDKLYATYLTWCALEGVQPGVLRDELYP
ncbi:MAG: 2,4'-dihydroxyacetophenone dioxygenase family protein [Hyphomonadaceae bacterium]